MSSLLNSRGRNSSYSSPEAITSRSRMVMSSKRGSRSASSGRYVVIGLSTLWMKPSSMAMPTNVDVKDFATEKDVTIESRCVPLKYFS